MPTEKIYYKNGMNFNFFAKVLSCDYDEKKNSYEIELDKTGFFPGGGGQDPDTGALYLDIDPSDVNPLNASKTTVPSDGNPLSASKTTDPSKIVKVTDMKEEKDGRILHYTDKPIDVGVVVYGMPDKAARFDRMQQHTAEHIISGIVNKMFGFDNVGFHLGEKVTTLDFNGFIEKDEVERIEEMANEAIWSCIPIKSYIPSKDELSNLNYRSKMDIDGDVRIVDIPGIDTCACCAPHLDHTGRAGLVKIIDAMRHRGGIRLTIVAGKRALLDYHIKENLVYGVSALISEKPEKIVDGVRRVMEDARETRGQLIEAVKNSIKTEVDSRLKEDANARIAIFIENSERTAIKLSLDYISSVTKNMGGIFTGNDEKGYSYAIVSKDTNLREWLKGFHERFPGKGGGKPEQVNGSVKALRADLEAFLR